MTGQNLWLAGMARPAELRTCRPTEHGQQGVRREAAARARIREADLPDDRADRPRRLR